jgi:hypothetical protein
MGNLMGEAGRELCLEARSWVNVKSFAEYRYGICAYGPLNKDDQQNVRTNTFDFEICKLAFVSEADQSRSIDEKSP